MSVPWVPAPELYDLEALMKEEFFTDRADTASEGENHYLADITGAKDRSYKPLVDKDEIRLLCLEPGDYGELRGELVHIHLDESPVYETLSYAWGPPYNTCKIKLPDGILQITESLFMGLIRLKPTGAKAALDRKVIY
ncbi:hypothetical protein NA56DRAFT_690559 [Hyaloscypha hepaticicola]|uniref:Heterokaryon incompatibility domain-containing protein n=1 Tax=Hyaloscypha hepaticicola TaxID=2082293 RepID=A0A2J6PYW3_9HELO|nr:hypothetical protein NA56DRAFT_690559 [Hyaloscypha hepaticicola]